jgi:acetolactate synthase-1/2/3 large subunit
MPDLWGGHLVARTLKQAGVGHVFTLCGSHILPIYDGCLTEDIAVVDMRHEQACAHAADAYARLTRNVGVAVVTAGPGVTDAVTGVANAYSARSPVLLIGGAAPLGLRGLGALQETEQVALLRPITKGAWTVADTRQIPEVLTTAIRTALTGRPGPVFVEIPVDLLMTSVEDQRPGQWLDPGPFGCLGVGPSFAIAAKLLRPDHRVLLIAGDGAFGLNGMELETAVRFGLPMTVVVGNDGGWGQIRNPQLSFFGAERAVGTSLPSRATTGWWKRWAAPGLT